MHQHRPQSSVARLWVWCVAPERCRGNDRSHGGVVYHESCRCNAQRQVEVNGGSRVPGPWRLPERPKPPAPVAAVIVRGHFGRVTIHDDGSVIDGDGGLYRFWRQWVDGLTPGGDALFVSVIPGYEGLAERVEAELRWACVPYVRA